jgi:hypothetical protein
MSVPIAWLGINGRNVAPKATFDRQLLNPVCHALPTPDRDVHNPRPIVDGGSVRPIGLIHGVQ